MTDHFSSDQIEEMLPAYVLGVLEPDEMLQFDNYLAAHPELLGQLHAHEETIAQLAHLAPTVPLPENGKAALLNRIQAEATVAPIADIPLPVAKPETPRISSQNETEAQPSPGWFSKLQTLFSPRRGWAFATVLSLMALIIAILNVGQARNQLEQVETQLIESQNQQIALQSEFDQAQSQAQSLQTELAEAQNQQSALQTEVAQLQAENQTLQQSYQTLEQQIQAEQDRLTFVSNITPNRIVLLPGTDAAPDATGQFYLGDNNEALLALSGLSPLTEQETYQLWLIPTDGAPISAGLVTVDTAPTAWQAITIPNLDLDFTAVGLSIEPAGGSPAPTGSIVLLGTTTG